MLLGGTDEAGIGALAGPIVAATLVIQADKPLTNLKKWWPIKGVEDSKKLTEIKRRALRTEILQMALELEWEVGYGIASVDHINKNGYAKAWDYALARAMFNATKAKDIRPKLMIIDGTRSISAYPLKQRSEPKADVNYFVVAAASILAKTYRDGLMIELDKEFPDYEWIRNKGYPTEAHKDGLLEHGLCLHHRTQPCKTVLDKVKGPRRRPEGW